MNMERAVGSTDSTDCTDWKLAEEASCFTMRLTADTAPDVRRVPVHLCNR
jgi:hypothetical protein